MCLAIYLCMIFETEYNVAQYFLCRVHIACVFGMCLCARVWERERCLHAQPTRAQHTLLDMFSGIYVFIYLYKHTYICDCCRCCYWFIVVFIIFVYVFVHSHTIFVPNKNSHTWRNTYYHTISNLLLFTRSL